METEGAVSRISRHPPQFRFEAGWLKEEDCPSIVENAWKKTVEARGGGVHEATACVAQELGGVE